jgi:hypothetical protein
MCYPYLKMWIKDSYFTFHDSSTPLWGNSFLSFIKVIEPYWSSLSSSEGNAAMQSGTGSVTTQSIFQIRHGYLTTQVHLIFKTGHDRFDMN